MRLVAVAKPSRPHGVRAGLTLDEILDAALGIVDHDGLDALSLRSVATALEVTPMSLYRYVQGTDDLLDRVVSRLVSRAGDGRPLPASWKDAVMTYAVRLRALLAEHPAYLNAAMRRPIINRPALTTTDALLGALRRAGLSPAAAADAYGALFSFCIGFSALEQGRARVREEDAETAAGATKTLRETLAQSGLPYLAESARHLGPTFDESRFRASLSVICLGIAAQARGAGLER